MYRSSINIYIFLLSFSFLFSSGFLSAHANNIINEIKALSGLKEVRAIYDLKVSKPKRFSFFLEVIGKTYDEITEHGLHPKFVVAVRGPAIRFISNEIWSFSGEDQKYLKEAAALITGLKQRGVRFEACSIAAGLFKIDQKTYLAGVTAVSNTFISLTGYQAQGYGLVPVN